MGAPRSQHCWARVPFVLCPPLFDHGARTLLGTCFLMETALNCSGWAERHHGLSSHECEALRQLAGDGSWASFPCVFDGFVYSVMPAHQGGLGVKGKRLLPPHANNGWARTSFLWFAPWPMSIAR